MRGAAALLLAGLIGCSEPAAALTLTEGSVWPTTDIPVCWEDIPNRYIQERRLARKAIRASWEKESALTFTGWRKCQPTSPGIRIRIGSQHPHTKARGKYVDGVRDGMVLPALWALAALSVNVKTPVHEMGHALGFGHEFARPGDEVPGHCRVVQRTGIPYVEKDLPLTSYDPYSIMVGCAATAQRDLSMGVPLLSAGDIYGLVSVYGSAPHNILDTSEDGDRFGASIALGDLDGDGVEDLAVGAPGKDQTRGAVYLFQGNRFQGFRPWRKLQPEPGTEAGAAWGQTVGIVTQIDGSGVSILVGAADGEVFQAVIETDLEASIAWSASHESDLFGSPKAVQTIIRDLDGDGIADRITGLATGTIRGANAGLVQVERGQTDGSHQFWYRFGQAY